MTTLNPADSNVTTTYREQEFEKTLYRVTNVYLGKFDLGKALEDLTVRKILREENNLHVDI